MLESKWNDYGYSFENRVVFQPMEGCDCELDGSPSKLTIAKYLSFARSGAAVIWFEANAVAQEGRTGKRQMMLTEQNLPAFQSLTARVRELAIQESGFAPKLYIQLTHSGRQSMIPMIAYRNPLYEKTRPLTDENIVSDEYLDSLPERFADSAALAKKAGFDGVDMKSCHGYLLQELLSAFNRSGKYGGSFENRSRLLLDCIAAIRSRVSPDFAIVSRIGISDMIPKPCGFGTDEKGELDLAEPFKLVALLRDAGVKVINVTLGNPYYNPHVNRPFRAGAYTPPEKPEVGLNRFYTVGKALKKEFPDMIFVGSGLSYYREDLMQKAEALLTGGAYDLVGFGRETLAYPEFYKDWLAGNFSVKKCCVACSRCTQLMRHGGCAGCAIHNETYKKLYDEIVLQKDEKRG